MMTAEGRTERARAAARTRWAAGLQDGPKSLNKMFALRLPPVVRAALQAKACDEGVTMTALIIEVLAERLGLPVPPRESPEVVAARNAVARAQEQLRKALESGKVSGQVGSD